MGADCGTLVNVALLVPIHGNLLRAFPDDRTRAGRNVTQAVDVSLRCPVGVLSSDVEVLLEELGSSAEGFSGRIIDPGPRILSPENEIRQENTGDRSVSHSVSGIARD